MKTTNLGYPRIGNQRELKKALENYWAGKEPVETLLETAKLIRRQNWLLQKEQGIDLIPSNDFSLYDQVLDMCMTLNAIPDRYISIKHNKNFSSEDLYFAMARGIQKDGVDITAMEMTKWFDTNYHYLVPEFSEGQKFSFVNSKIIDEYKEALALGIKTKPVLIGPVSFLLLGKEKNGNFNRIDLLNELLPSYYEILKQLTALDAEHVQFDEPYLATELSNKEREAIRFTYTQIADKFPELKITLANYFDCFGENLNTVLELPVHTLHLDLVRCNLQLDDILNSNKLKSNTHLSLGVVDGRNIWKNDFEKSLELIQKAVNNIGEDRILIAPSCSLIHSPCDLELEKNEANLSAEVKQWLAFAKQKLEEVKTLRDFAAKKNLATTIDKVKANVLANKNRKTSTTIHNPEVKQRVEALTTKDDQRINSFSVRQKLQQTALNLPLYPTTTIGSFPQTKEVRSQRANFKKGNISTEDYNTFLEKETRETIKFQENAGLDVLVHGEFERNDMVEYFGEKLNGFAFTSFGWVQSYGSRCVKPPIIFGDVSRENPMTVEWSSYAQSLTKKPVKGMLTGPVTILQWSFVRNDQPRSQTCAQIALAIRDEVVDLEKAGLQIIQIDEPAIREGLPLRKADWEVYLNWAIKSFRISASGVQDQTQIHTHMCYSEFNDIIQNIADMDADVITIECSRSQMELLDVFHEFKYPNEIGPGVYDIHSPRVPERSEMVALIEKANKLIPAEQLWINPDCGLKTRHWEETKKALIEMVAAAQECRKKVAAIA
ncbi:5-methyltetrahydropteroyltriglutamate--homocysteine S-methyltransferase [Cellulophaga sp. HaHaR_3_176]|uniref:5-methyltetrahydropteroyltriglutamate-- homocysteine S-methyltransferase n=1 Tax=Cellulophaga sp. HaHaR_3_176 TaxID=1942464 RepID=UPI001C1FC1B2|nr:5-methyltetrahydropteroyltriglutamate--homocysteine S-methyltransferase [Cellulophaga sp. HaHaR_3_176]QWX85564.1 5-methyltetrahydropteroyltriglutamate--homocysteine S-methyltransferase [Cellulophaga sp. HaHaR_3_176]